MHRRHGSEGPLLHLLEDLTASDSYRTEQRIHKEVIFYKSTKFTAQFVGLALVNHILWLLHWI